MPADALLVKPGDSRDLELGRRTVLGERGSRSVVAEMAGRNG